MSGSDELADVIPLFGRRRPKRSQRRIALSTPVNLRLHVDLAGSEPEIWRRVDIRSDATLDVVHAVLQAAFAWEDYHLYRFALGGDPFDPEVERFGSPPDAAENDDVERADRTRLDEVLQEPGDTVHYVYDFGDAWQVTLTVQEVLPAVAGMPVARCVAGARAAPQEDSGGMVDGESLARLLDDPEFFDITEVNSALGRAEPVELDTRLDPRVLDLIERLPSHPRHRLATRLAALGDRVCPPESELTESLRSVQWFLDRATGDGLTLTAAGNLKPADVTSLGTIFPDLAGWRHAPRRENSATSITDFRGALARIGLLRKTKGRLVTTKAGERVRTDPALLFEHIAARLIPAKATGFQLDAAMVILAIGATNDNDRFPWADAADYLSELGWTSSNFGPVDQYALYHFTHNPFALLANIAPEPHRGLTRFRLRPVARELARAALLSEDPS